jgi:hypothetical protein
MVILCFLRTNQKMVATSVNRKNQIADANESVVSLKTPIPAPNRAMIIHDISNMRSIVYCFTVILPVTLKILYLLKS